jgi:hypothetical protein
LLIDEKRDSFLPAGSWIVLFWLPAETLSLKRLHVLENVWQLIFCHNENAKVSSGRSRKIKEKCAPFTPVVIPSSSSEGTKETRVISLHQRR